LHFSCLVWLRFPTCYFQEPTNHLDQEAIKSLLEAMAKYPGALVVVSHDRPFCEAVQATHVAYVANGVVKVEERSLSEKDWSETDVGTRLSLDLAKVDETRRQKVAVEPKAAEPAAPAPAPAPAPRVAYVPEVKKVKAAVFQGQGASAEMRLSSAGADLAGKEKVHYSDAKAKKDLADLEKQDKLAKAAAKGCAPLKKKEAKAMYAEYDEIEAKVEATEEAALAAESALTEARSRRATMTEMSQLASASSTARRVADQTVSRWIELEEMVEKHEEAGGDRP